MVDQVESRASAAREVSIQDARRIVAQWIGKQTSVSIAATTKDVPVQHFVRRIPEGNVACVVEGEARVVQTPPRVGGRLVPVRRKDVERPHYTAAPLRLYAINEARFDGSARYFADARGRIVRESIRHWHPRSSKHPITLRKAQRVFAHVPKATGPRLPGIHVLAASTYAANYYHWHFDLLPGVALLYSLMPGEPFKILVGAEKDFMRGSLQFLGIDPARLVVIPTENSISVEHLVICSTQQNTGLNIHPRIGEMLRAIKRGALGDDNTRPSRRIFLSRGDSKRRRLLNREDVERRFAAEGFQVVDAGTLDYADQVRLFHEAEIVVGEHGAGMANTGFCQLGTTIIEVFHPIRNDLCYFSLAQLLGLRHQIFLGKAEPPRPGSRFDWRADVEAAVAFVASAREDVSSPAVQ